MGSFSFGTDSIFFSGSAFASSGFSTNETIMFSGIYSGLRIWISGYGASAVISQSSQ